MNARVKRDRDELFKGLSDDDDEDETISGDTISDEDLMGADEA